MLQTWRCLCSLNASCFLFVRSPGPYAEALICVFDIVNECLRQSGENVDILPSNEQLRNGIKYMCANVEGKIKTLFVII